MFKKIKKSFATIATTAMLVGSLSSVASAEPGYEHKEKTIEYNCTAKATILFIPITVPMSMSAKIEADVPTSVPANQQFTVEDAFVTVTIPEADIATLKSHLGWTSFKGNATKFEVKADNPAQTKNAANPAIPIPETPVPNDDLVFRVPASSGIDVNFMAGSSGNVNLSAGDISATFAKGDSSGGFNVPLNVDCQPKLPQDLTLATIPIN